MKALAFLLQRCVLSSSTIGTWSSTLLTSFHRLPPTPPGLPLHDPFSCISANCIFLWKKYKRLLCQAPSALATSMVLTFHLTAHNHLPLRRSSSLFVPHHLFSTCCLRPPAALCSFILPASLATLSLVATSLTNHHVTYRQLARPQTLEITSLISWSALPTSTGTS